MLGASIAGEEESKETLKPPRCNLSARVDTTAVGVGLITRGAKEGDALAYAERRGRNGAPVRKAIRPVKSRIDTMQLECQLPRDVVGEFTVLLPSLNRNIAKCERGTAQDA
jgi:hypothetical protein